MVDRLRKQCAIIRRRPPVSCRTSPPALHRECCAHVDCATLAVHGARRWKSLGARARRDGARAAAASFSWWRRRLRRPPLRRVSGDVVTAGLISSRVWFGPVPGSP
ncbi:hypothetical protein F511_45898 [Dorcoceras hygrometricum]|uniref:Uncharacterized protein n=1 Tax=Dorcoceras hygrometricum TaxID=472368 RepID=A0A2Z6ZUX8_9LAMI|nr:hypothetical protein F511_45898 [Dorcoceras hygrometricum]